MNYYQETICQYCFVRLMRQKSVKRVTCFDCKIKRKKIWATERAEKRRKLANLKK